MADAMWSCPRCGPFSASRHELEETWSSLTCFCQAVWHNPERRNWYNHEKLWLYCLLSYGRAEVQGHRVCNGQSIGHLSLSQCLLRGVPKGHPPSLFPLGGHWVLFPQQLPWFLGADLVHSLSQFSSFFLQILRLGCKCFPSLLWESQGCLAHCHPTVLF